MKPLRGPCASCGVTIEYPAEMVGTHAQCPHCGNTTELLLHQPKDEPLVPRNVLVWTLAAVLILLMGLGGAIYALKRAQKWSENRRPVQQQNPSQ